MLYLVLTFVSGFFIPFIARRLGKILPATMGIILFELVHRPRFAKTHNPLQYARFRKKWQTLFIYSIVVGCINMILSILAHYYLPTNIHLFAYAFIWLVLCAAETDYRYMILPDCLTLPLLLIGFLFAVQTSLISPLQSIMGCFFAYLITTLSVFLLNFKKQTIFGAGDSKMAIAFGAWLGMNGLNYAIFISFFLFVIYSFFIKRRTGAYGPALGLAGLFCFFILYAK